MGQSSAGSRAQCRWLGEELVYFILTTVRVMLPHLIALTVEEYYSKFASVQATGIHGQRGLFKL